MRQNIGFNGSILGYLCSTSGVFSINELYTNLIPKGPTLVYYLVVAGGAGGAVCGGGGAGGELHRSRNPVAH